jgi:hypothetical protein
MKFATRLFVCLALSALIAVWAEGVYESKAPSKDGTGKVYMGREISFVLGHRGIHWLERAWGLRC